MYEHECYLVGCQEINHENRLICKKCENRISKDDNIRKHMKNEHVSDIESDENHCKRENSSAYSSILKSFESKSEDETPTTLITG